ncbi:hypothetical protein CNMCM5623_003710 [Aspergillus felis]|uniref:Guanyl-nucleotide exchange factor n=1 Tax=Aspergillus felis TaxID=1287682 RepID=A0A8H6UMI9_9EURO|nr:hypothetical protein CNMCM5623_003710 [Aspergillus felis]
MHWKGLRLGALDSNDSKRRSVVEPQPLSRHSEQLPRPTLSTTNLASRHSESAPRSPLLAGPDPDDENDHDDHETGDNDNKHLSEGPANTIRSRKGNVGAALVPGDASTWRRNRFSFMKLRHASDPQLSRSYAKGEEGTPPVPPLPREYTSELLQIIYIVDLRVLTFDLRRLPPAPTIITTAPTSNELDQPVKKKPKFKILSGSKKDPSDGSPMHSQRQSPGTRSRHGAQGSNGSQTTDATLSTTKMSGEEPGRLSTTSIRSGGREPGNESQRSSVTDARFSESSRSDQSSGDHGLYHPHSPNDGTVSGSKRFRMPRLKRNRGPVFPLPPRPAGSQPMNGHGQGSQISRAMSSDPSSSFEPPNETDQDRVSPLPSPSRSTVGLASPAFPLRRKDSANSANSARSATSTRSGHRIRPRPRSSTLDSLANLRDAGQQSPAQFASSGRTSTSTSGRKSFGDIFSISHRLRQNSEPPVLRNGSPGVRGSDTPVRKLSYPEREENDTPATYLTRLEESIPKSTIGGVLCQSNEDFYKTALRKYMRRFIFFGDPIDMAIRKLLMGAELPKETQQIDRFLQSFADRYHECNPGIFASPDQAYFIAFSILILHTDVFNKNNKRKMQKPDYVRNTRGEGVSDDILECIYENIAYTPFIHIEDTPSHGRQLAKPRRPLFKTPSSEHLSRVSREPVDPYTLIMDGKLDSLRPSLKDVMNLEDTYQCHGTTGPPDINSLHQAFSKTAILQIVSARSRPDAFMPASIQNPAESNPGLVDIKVAKVGLLWRKDPRKKRARSPWQEWGALLTFSQLYFFRDVNWIKSLMSQYESHQKEGRRRAVVFRPPLIEFKPDGIMSTDDAVALVDSSYKKHKHAFLFVRHNALEEVFLANSEDDMNDWLAKINYAAAFRSTGVRTKSMIATNYESQRDRMSRKPSVTSHNSHRSADREPPSPNPDTDVTEEWVTARRELMRQKIRETDEKLFASQKQLDDLLRNARHLQVLTPVTSRAREQVIMAAGRMAAKLKWVRQDIWRNKCYREVLLQDLGTEDEEAKLLADQRSLNLQIPTRNASTSEPGALPQPPANAVRSPSQAASPQLPSDEPGSVHRVRSSQIAPSDIRRPSIPVSVTSSDLTGRAGRRLSTEMGKDRAKSYSPGPANRLEREPSVLSAGSKIDVASLGSHASKLTSPISMDDGEERILREAGLLEVNSSPRGNRQSVTAHETDGEHRRDSGESRPGEQMSRIRRSLHRTLRDSHHGQQGPGARGKKPRDSMSSEVVPEDEQDTKEGEGLSRKAPQFTVHGKKASIVTFGSEWQNMTPEERLRLRKPTPSEEPRASDPAILGGGDSSFSELVNPGISQSLRSGSTATRISVLDPVEGESSNDGNATSKLEDVKAKSDPAIDLSSHLPASDDASLADSSPAAFPGSLVVPKDQQSSPSTSADEAVVDENTIQNLQSSPPEQASREEMSSSVTGLDRARAGEEVQGQGEVGVHRPLLALPAPPPSPPPRSSRRPVLVPVAGDPDEMLYRRTYEKKTQSKYIDESIGYGLFATGRIPAGEVVFADKVVWLAGAEVQRWKNAKAADDLIAEKVRMMGEEWHRRFLGLPNPQPKGSSGGVYAQIWKRYHMIALQPENAKVLVLGLNLAFVNHSCIPNASLYYTLRYPRDENGEEDKSLPPRIGRAVVRASRDIKPGEEITVPYFYAKGECGVRQLMSSMYCKFWCVCPFCREPVRETENALEKLYTLETIFEDADTLYKRPAVVFKNAYELIKLYERLKISDTREVQVWLCCAMIAGFNCDLGRAMLFLIKARGLVLSLHGPNGHLYDRIRVYCQTPPLMPGFGATTRGRSAVKQCYFMFADQKHSADVLFMLTAKPDEYIRLHRYRRIPDSLAKPGESRYLIRYDAQDARRKKFEDEEPDPVEFIPWWYDPEVRKQIIEEKKAKEAERKEEERKKAARKKKKKKEEQPGAKNEPKKRADEDDEVENKQEHETLGGPWTQVPPYEHEQVPSQPAVREVAARKKVVLKTPPALPEIENLAPNELW